MSSRLSFLSVLVFSGLFHIFKDICAIFSQIANFLACLRPSSPFSIYRLNSPDNLRYALLPLIGIYWRAFPRRAPFAIYSSLLQFLARVIAQCPILQRLPNVCFLLLGHKWICKTVEHSLIKQSSPTNNLSGASCVTYSSVASKATISTHARVQYNKWTVGGVSEGESGQRTDGRRRRHREPTAPRNSKRAPRSAPPIMTLFFSCDLLLPCTTYVHTRPGVCLNLPSVCR